MYYLSSIVLLLSVCTGYIYYLYATSYMNFYCNKCVHQQCPISYIQYRCELAQTNNNVYTDILEDPTLDEYERIKKYSIKRGEEMEKCIFQTRNKCRSFCSLECNNNTNNNIPELSYDVIIHAQNNTKSNFHFEECVLDNINFFNINSECWVSINKEKCLHKYYNQTLIKCS